MSHVQDRHAIDSEGFYVASFGIDGALEGEGRWRHRDLSDQWLRVCDELIQEKGVNFDHLWTGALSKIRTKMTSAQGASICTFFVNDQVASSLLLLRGEDLESERDVSEMFVESLRKAGLVLASNDLSELFSEVLSITLRPLMVVIPFPDAAISDKSYDLVRELSLHLASAFIRGDA